MYKLIDHFFKVCLRQKFLALTLVLFGVLQGFCLAPSFAQSSPSLNLAPVDHAGVPWKIAYVETRPFGNYAATLSSMVTQLHKMGWIKSVDGMPYEEGQIDAQVIWEWLARKKNEPYLQFLENGFYTYDKLKGEKADERTDEIVERLSKTKEIDLILVMGTEAGERLAPYNLPVNMMVMSTSNAYRAGIINGTEFSEKPRVWAHMDPYRFKRQIEIFYDVFKFKSLGVVFDDDVAGRNFAAIDDVMEVSKQYNFKVVTENIPQPAKYGANKAQFSVDLENAYARLSTKVDAVYVGLFAGRDPNLMPQIFSPLTKKKIPVFAQQSTDVASGALMALTRQSFAALGGFNSRAMVRILKGEQANKISQIYEDSPNIMINLDVAKAIGFRPRFELLLAADKIIKEKK